MKMDFSVSGSQNFESPTQSDEVMHLATRFFKRYTCLILSPNQLLNRELIHDLSTMTDKCYKVTSALIELNTFTAKNLELVTWDAVGTERINSPNPAYYSNKDFIIIPYCIDLPIESLNKIDKKTN